VYDVKCERAASLDSRPESSTFLQSSEYAVSHDNVFALKNPAPPNEVRDTLPEVLREGARTLLAHAIKAEAARSWRGILIGVTRRIGRGSRAMATYSMACADGHRASANTETR